MQKKFEEIEHTADIALQVWGKDLPDLFLNSAAGMYSLVNINEEFKGPLDWKFNASDNNIENLLVIFLNELNYCISIKRKLVCLPIEIQILENSEIYKLSCKAKSQNIPQDIFEELVEIKAVTYHDLNIKNEDDFLTAKIVFDI